MSYAWPGMETDIKDHRKTYSRCSGSTTESIQPNQTVAPEIFGPCLSYYAKFIAAMYDLNTGIA